MTRSIASLAVTLLTFVAVAGDASAQSIGIGAGIVVPGGDIAQLPESVREDGWTEVEQRAEQGYFIEARAKLGGTTALVGGISYNRFLDAVSEYRDGEGRGVTLISSQSIVPLSVGLEHHFSDGMLSPYVSLEGTLSYFYRAYETPRDGMPVPFSIESSGEARYGAALGGGLSLDLTLLRFDLATRLQIVNLFGSTSTTEETMFYLQLGALAYFGL